LHKLKNQLFHGPYAKKKKISTWNRKIGRKTKIKDTHQN
jgi:hypothetical protein